MDALSDEWNGMRHLVVYGNSDRVQLAVSHSKISLRVKHDSIDFTGLIAVVDHLSELLTIHGFDRLFYMHDSMTVFNRDAFVSMLARYGQSRTCSLQMGSR